MASSAQSLACGVNPLLLCNKQSQTQWHMAINMHFFMHLRGSPHPGWACLEDSADFGWAHLDISGQLGWSDLGRTWLVKLSFICFSSVRGLSSRDASSCTRESAPRTSFCLCHFCQHHVGRSKHMAEHGRASQPNRGENAWHRCVGKSTDMGRCEESSPSNTHGLLVTSDLGENFRKSWLWSHNAFRFSAHRKDFTDSYLDELPCFPNQ